VVEAIRQKQADIDSHFWLTLFLPDPNYFLLYLSRIPASF
jgi:hypothetical protein